MITMSGFRTFVFSALLAAALCAGYLKYRDVEHRRKELRDNRDAIERVRLEVRELETRLEQTRERIKALESDPVEGVAAARRVGRAVQSKSEIVYHLDESKMNAPVPAETVPPQNSAPAAAPPSGPAGTADTTVTPAEKTGAP